MLYRLEDKIIKLNDKMYNNFHVDLMAYYMRREKWAEVNIQLAHMTELEKRHFLVVKLYYAYDKIPTLSKNIYIEDGKMMVSNDSSTYLKLSARPERRDFAKIQKFTRYLTKEILLKWHETGEINLPSWDGL